MRTAEHVPYQLRSTGFGNRAVAALSWTSSALAITRLRARKTSDGSKGTGRSAVGCRPRTIPAALGSGPERTHQASAEGLWVGSFRVTLSVRRRVLNHPAQRKDRAASVYGLRESGSTP